MAGTPVLVNGTSIQTDKYFVTSVKVEPVKVMNPYVISHANKSVIPSKEYPNAVVTLVGQVIGESILEEDNLIDGLQTILGSEDSTVDIGWAGSFRRYYGTPTVPDITRDGGLAYANFSVTFYCTSPFGAAPNPVSAVNVTGVTTANASYSHTFQGNAPFQLPVFTYTLTAVGDTTSKTVTIGNNATGQSVAITRIWTAGDTVTINPNTSEVRVNNQLFDAVGAFPTFRPGAQSIGYSDNFSTRTYSLIATYFPLYR